MNTKIVQCLARDIDKLSIPAGELVEIELLDKSIIRDEDISEYEKVDVAPEQYWYNEIYYNNK